MSRLRRRFIRIVAPAIVVALAAAGFWRWSGANSETELSFAGAIEVTTNPGGYTFGNVRAAAGKLWRDAKGVLTHLLQQEALSPEMRRALLECLDNPVPVLRPSSGRFEELRFKVHSGVRLNSAEEAVLIQDLCAGIAAMRQTVLVDPKHGTYAQIMSQRLRDQLAPSHAPPASDPNR